MELEPHLLSTDTPRKTEARAPEVWQLQNTDEASVTQLRAARRYTVQCSVDDFRDSYLAQRTYKPLPDRTLARIQKVLCQRNIIDSGGQWIAMIRPKVQPAQQSTPKDTSLTENAHFAKMVTVMEDVLSAAAEVCPSRFCTQKKTTEFVCRPNCQTASEVPGAAFRVDALNYLMESSYPREFKAGTAYNFIAVALGHSVRIYTADVGTTYEFKLTAGVNDIVKNELHTLHTAQHILFNDIRRTCHFAVTIENSSARLWCHTRSHTIVTERFDIHTGAKHLIQFLLFSSFGTPSQLGFDPNACRVVVGKELHYQFDVILRDGKRRKYRSVRIEHENSATELYGRAMRVFKIIDCDLQNSPYLALRDYWLFEDDEADEGGEEQDPVLGEAQIKDLILDKLREILPEADFLIIERHFMTILADGVVTHKGVRQIVPRPPKGAKVYEYGNELNPKGIPAKKPVLTMASRGVDAPFKGPERKTTYQQRPIQRPLQLHARKHCRTVYAELCEDLWRVHEPAKFFFAMYQTMYILGMLRRAGFMHRDISLGNLLLHCLDSESAYLSQRYITKIADLEYVRYYGQTTRHDPITATDFFTAIEVQAKQHLFMDERRTDIMAMFYFAYNPLHDVESVVWMAIYFALHHCSRKVLEDTQWDDMHPRLLEIERYAQFVFFPRIHGSTPRQGLIKKGKDVRKFRDYLSHLYGDDSVMTKLPDAIDCLRDTYYAVEQAVAVTQEQQKVYAARAPDVPRLPLSVFEANAAVYGKLRSIFLEITQHFVDAGDPSPFVALSAIDHTCGQIVADVKEDPSSEAAVLPSLKGIDAPCEQVPRKTQGKRKVDDLDSASKKGATTKRACTDSQTAIRRSPRFTAKPKD